MSDQQTWMDLVREIWPGISDDDGEMVLWNATSFPFGTVESVAAGLREKYVQSGGDPAKAVDIAMLELDEAMATVRQLEGLDGTSL